MIAIFTFINIVDAYKRHKNEEDNKEVLFDLFYFILFINKNKYFWKHLKEEMSCILKIKMNKVKNK